MQKPIVAGSIAGAVGYTSTLPLDFLKQHQNLFPVSFNEIKFAYNDVNEDSVTELYHFLNAENKVIGKAKFLFDSYGRLIRMTILE